MMKHHTIKSLIKSLKKFPADMDVLVAQDSEGNGFSKLADEHISISPVDDNEEPVHPDDATEKSKRVVVFWPV